MQVSLAPNCGLKNEFFWLDIQLTVDDGMDIIEVNIFPKAIFMLCVWGWTCCIFLETFNNDLHISG